MMASISPQQMARQAPRRSTRSRSSVAAAPTLQAPGREESRSASSSRSRSTSVSSTSTVEVEASTSRAAAGRELELETSEASESEQDVPEEQHASARNDHATRNRSTRSRSSIAAVPEARRLSLQPVGGASARRSRSRSAAVDTSPQGRSTKAEGAASARQRHSTPKAIKGRGKRQSVLLLPSPSPTPSLEAQAVRDDEESSDDGYNVTVRAARPPSISVEEDEQEAVVADEPEHEQEAMVPDESDAGSFKEQEDPEELEQAARLGLDMLLNKKDLALTPGERDMLNMLRQSALGGALPRSVPRADPIPFRPARRNHSVERRSARR